VNVNVVHGNMFVNTWKEIRVWKRKYWLVAHWSLTEVTSGVCAWTIWSSCTFSSHRYTGYSMH